jgi:hypothetical protein
MYLTLFALESIERKRCSTPPHLYVCSKPFHEISLNLETDKHSVVCTNHLILICVSPLGLPSPSERTRLDNISNNNRSTINHGLATDK